uniref:Uncharacterized protein n=1 Tax=Rhabditophanes sp. KR3021 TaxID=114890 RepID=A0AC35TJ21_9BILA
METLQFDKEKACAELVDTKLSFLEKEEPNKLKRKYDPRINYWEKFPEIPIKRNVTAVCLNGSNITYSAGACYRDRK